MDTIKKDGDDKGKRRNGQKPKLLKRDIPMVIKELREVYGNVSAVARKLKVSRTTLYNFINKHQQIKDELADTREELVDIAESALFKNILAGDAASIFFFLKTQGKHRGYVERKESFGDGVDLSQLSDEQLERLDNGESLFSVLRG